MDSQGGDTYYANLLSESSNHEDELGMEFSNQRNQASHIFQKLGSTTNRSRGTNFTIEEDILLISAWLNISLDAVQGNEQKHKAYWLRVWEYFHEHKKFVSDRSQTSLMHRWSTIQIATNKFCGCYAQIESKRNSDVAEKDQVLMELKIDIFIIFVILLHGNHFYLSIFRLFKPKLCIVNCMDPHFHSTIVGMS